MNNLSITKKTHKVILVVFLVTISIIGTSKSLNSHDYSISVITIDAGHGGKDSGCGGESGEYEKDVALEIALQLGKMLEDSLPDVKVIYTRTKDEFVPLWKRAQIANRNMSDLFISIHCNAHTTTALSGGESYVMGLNKAGGNLKVTKRENDAIKFETATNENHYSDFDPESPEGHIRLSMYQNANLKLSVKLASYIQKRVNSKGKILDLGVRQAGFMVLWKTTMPSVLIETGYLTNKKDEDYLTSEQGKNETAFNIFDAVKEFKSDYEQLYSSQN